ncbi:hypothetical protein N658DRAFT_28344 [Parathielavia hyrcaniae]|uniref:Uncharacterized protein n=1 Tax=Parathielavia hyrcaniae TaxID=113614 RepID=A0AAN6QG09_9PEZI|nr:hypothetical protein N658DRAFT_28344 [Parathielavia hyrcaniae]
MHRSSIGQANKLESVNLPNAFRLHSSDQGYLGNTDEVVTILGPECPGQSPGVTRPETEGSATFVLDVTNKYEVGNHDAIAPIRARDDGRSRLLGDQALAVVFCRPTRHKLHHLIDMDPRRENISHIRALDLRWRDGHARVGHHAVLLLCLASLVSHHIHPYLVFGTSSTPQMCRSQDSTSNSPAPTVLWRHHRPPSGYKELEAACCRSGPLPGAVISHNADEPGDSEAEIFGSRPSRPASTAQCFISWLKEGDVAALELIWAVSSHHHAGLCIQRVDQRKKPNSQVWYLPP